MHWIWEATGNVGKACLLRTLWTAAAPLKLQEHAVTREDIYYETIEKGKDGKVFNSKYEGKLVRYARPHVLCFSNQPPDLTMLSADRYHVIQLGVDLAMDRVAPAVEAAPEQPAMQGGGGGAGSGKVVVLHDSDDDDDDTNNDN